ncbi:MAG TPA: flagellin [Pedomonas sp.]|uniref:flagellin n=1 Tax=Pedomonas sp. TaxID=2976421 RepID=UPI002F41DD4C
MTRVASYSHNQSLLQGMLRNQADLYKTQQQINTGKKADDYKGIAPQASTVVTARAAMSRTEAYKDTANEISQTLSLIDLKTGSMLEATEALKQSILEALAMDNGQGFGEILESNFQMIASALNTKIGNSYLFGGGQTTEKPFTATSLDDLAGLASASDAFVNDQTKSSVRVTDTFTMQYGVLADEVATPVMEVIKALKEFHDDPMTGPINGDLTPAQVTFLEARLADIDAATQGMRTIQTANGLRQSQMKDVTEQLKQQSVYYETFVADIEDVDMAEAITRFNADQAALEVSYRAVSLISQLNLSKYI